VREIVKDLWRQPLVWGVAGVVTLGVVIVGVLLAFRPQVPLPVDITKQLSFPLVYPPTKTSYTMDKKSASYSASAKVLIFHAKADNLDLTISEQATPDTINDIPEYYPKLIEKLNGYSDFDSLNGKVSLTHPKELNGGQTAVFNGKGTLMFVKPSHDMSNDEWRTFFNSLVVKQ
jgi:hypothetical protein